MAKKETFNLSNKDARYIIAYLITNNKTNSYKFTQTNGSVNNNSLRAMANQYHNKDSVQQLFPVIKQQFVRSAIDVLQEDGYKVLNPKEATEYIVNQLTEQKEVKAKARNSNRRDTGEMMEVIENTLKLSTVGSKPLKDQLIELHETDKQKLKELINEVCPDIINRLTDNKCNEEKDNCQGNEIGREEKEEEEVSSGTDSNFILPDLDSPDIDLSNKDDLLKELQRRYKIELDPKVKNDIAKMIIDVQNMKKQEQTEIDNVQKKMYLPLRKCEMCPQLHTVLNVNGYDNNGNRFNP